MHCLFQIINSVMFPQSAPIMLKILKSQNVFKSSDSFQIPNTCSWCSFWILQLPFEDVYHIGIYCLLRQFRGVWWDKPLQLQSHTSKLTLLQSSTNFFLRQVLNSWWCHNQNTMKFWFIIKYNNFHGLVSMMKFIISIPEVI